MIVKRKGFAYITHQQRLLVFTHRDYPDAGIQVPAGSLNADETPEVGALREAHEETGLENLRLVRFLGEAQFDRTPYGKAERHTRYFYHIAAEGEVDQEWMHAEYHPSEGDDPGPIWFEFFWVELPNGLPQLIAGHDTYIPALLKSLSET